SAHHSPAEGSSPTRGRGTAASEVGMAELAGRCSGLRFVVEASRTRARKGRADTRDLPELSFRMGGILCAAAARERLLHCRSVCNTRPGPASGLYALARMT